MKDLVFIGLCLSLDEILSLAEEHHRVLLRFYLIFLFRVSGNGKTQLSTKGWFDIISTEGLRRLLKSEGWVGALGSKGCWYSGAPAPSSPVPLRLFQQPLSLQALNNLFIQSTPGFREPLWNFLNCKEPMRSPQLVSHPFHSCVVIRVCYACVGYRDLTFSFTSFWKLSVFSRHLTFQFYIGVL